MKIEELINKEYLGDCLELMKMIPDKSVHLIVCDLPYNETSSPTDILIPMNDHIVVTGKRNKQIQLQYDKFRLYMYDRNEYHLMQDRWDAEHIKGLWTHFNRIITDSGNVILFSQGHFMSYLIESNPKMYRYDTVWNKILKSNHLNSSIQPLRQHESFLIFNKNGCKQSTYNPQYSEGQPLHGKGTAYLTKETKNQNYGEYRQIEDYRKGETKKFPSSIVTYVKPTPAKSRHKTEKSVELLEYIIKTYSNPGETVGDFTAGSGSLGEAAINTGRNYILMENDPVEFEKMQNNIRLHKAKLNLI